MAKMKTSDDEMDRELVTNCDRSFEVVAICDHLKKEENHICQSEIEKLILTIRGEQVIIDQDVARLYNVGHWTAVFGSS